MDFQLSQYICFILFMRQSRSSSDLDDSPRLRPKQNKQNRQKQSIIEVYQSQSPISTLDKPRAQSRTISTFSQRLLANTLKQGIGSIQYFPILYFRTFDTFCRSKGDMVPFNSLFEQNNEKQNFQILAYVKGHEQQQILQAKARKFKTEKDESDEFIFYTVKIRVRDQRQRFCERIIKLPKCLQRISIKAIRELLGLPLYLKNQSYYLQRQDVYDFTQNTEKLFHRAQLFDIQFQKVPASKELVEIQMQQTKPNQYLLCINSELIQYCPEKKVLITIFITHNDRHYKIPLYLKREDYQKKTALDLKKRITQYLEKYFYRLTKNKQIHLYELRLLSQDKIRNVADAQIIESLLKDEVNRFRFQRPKYQTRFTVSMPSGKSKNILSFVNDRFAFLLPSNQLLIKTKIGLMQIFAKQFQKNIILASNEVHFKKDKQCDLLVEDVYSHKGVVGCIVKIQYGGKKQIKTLQLYQNNVVIYAYEQSPHMYLFSTASILASLYDPNRNLYIFDSHNNSHKLTNIKKLPPKRHFFYAFQTNKDAKSNMIVVDNIRILNIALLSQAKTLVSVSELQSKEINSQKLLQLCQEQIDHSQNPEKIDQNEYQLEISQYHKIHPSQKIHLNHKIPHINDRQSLKRQLHRDFYQSQQYYFRIQKENIKCLSGKLQQNSIIYIQQSVTAKTKFMKPNMSSIKFKVKFNHYYCNKEPTAQLKLKQKNYYFVTKENNENFYQVIELESPSFSSNIMIVWVDDQPSSNLSIIKQVSQQMQNNLSVQFNQIISTQMAIGWFKLFYPYFKWINPKCEIKMITDMKRGQNYKAGADVIQQINKLGVSLQCLIYSGEYFNTQKIIESYTSIDPSKLLVTDQRYQICKWCKKYALEHEETLTKFRELQLK